MEILIPAILTAQEQEEQEEQQEEEEQPPLPGPQVMSGPQPALQPPAPPAQRPVFTAAGQWSVFIATGQWSVFISTGQSLVITAAWQSYSVTVLLPRAVRRPRPFRGPTPSLFLQPRD